ncbi:hypothetical protein HYH02_008603 [Chlamydomonas schloesseri]|uniref:Uncharacterized protein n=1 Tax=Chlamydomonas schloesseri TaxID=2026947 RepID=A0A835WCY4_9CHLO|nr:hypothetical protein HYH02_008603 [Chlamydomonas schloesseri]|eukprot:KAG2445135.1 hypothetical protein HYH02_008603 [Chlamydomonas schloesseri]
MPLRRANSVPVHPPEVGSLPQNVLQQLDTEVPSAPSITDPRSPTADGTTTTFSPVFDLELGSAANTPQAPQRDRQRAGHRGTHHRGPFAVHHDPGAAPFASAAGALQALPRLQPPPPRVPAVLPGAAPAGTVRQQPLVQRSPATAAACAAAAMDRSQSDLQVTLQHGGAKAAAGAGAAALTPAAQRIMDLCRPASELELELSRRLRAFRAARIAKPMSAFKASSGALASLAPAAAAATPPASDGIGGQAALGAQQQQPSLLSASSSPPGPTPGEIEALATELLGAGFVVQLLDGTRLSRDTRSCLRTLKHRFLVCVGWDRPATHTAVGTGVGAGVAAGAGAGGVSGGSSGVCGSGSEGQAGQDSQPTEPLVVEVRFREQFLIAHPTRGYEQLLLALPVVFVGTLRRLDAVVEVMAAEVAAAFRQAGRPLPPWRTKGAMLSKWAPEQLVDLGRLMQQAALMQHMAAAQQAAQAAQAAAAAHGAHGAGMLVTGPLAPNDLDASWGSGITVEQPAALWGGAAGVATGPLPAMFANLPGAPSAVTAAAAAAAAATAAAAAGGAEAGTGAVEPAAVGAGAPAAAGADAGAAHVTSYVPMMPSAFANCSGGGGAGAIAGAGPAVGAMGPIAAVAAAAAAAAGGCGPHSARLRAPAHGPPSTTGFFYVRDEPNSGELDLMGCGDLAPAKSVSAPSSSHATRVPLLAMAAAAGAAASCGGAGSMGGGGGGGGSLAGSVARVLSVGAAALQSWSASGVGGVAALPPPPLVAAGGAAGSMEQSAQVDHLLPLMAGAGSPTAAAAAASSLAAAAAPAAAALAGPMLTLQDAGRLRTAAAEAEASDAAWGHGARGQSMFAAALARAQAPASIGLPPATGVGAVHVLNTQDLARIAQTSGCCGSSGGGLPATALGCSDSAAAASGSGIGPAAATGAAWRPPHQHLSAPHAMVAAAAGPGAGATGASGGFTVASASGLLEPSSRLYEPAELTVGWPEDDEDDDEEEDEGEDEDEGDGRLDDDEGSLGAAELPPALVGSSGDAAFGGGGFGSAVGSSGGLTFPILPGAGLQHRGLGLQLLRLDAPVSADGVLLASQLPPAQGPPLSAGAFSPFARASMPEGVCGGGGGAGAGGSRVAEASEYWDSGDGTPGGHSPGGAAVAPGGTGARTEAGAAAVAGNGSRSGSSSQHGRSGQQSHTPHAQQQPHRTQHHTQHHHHHHHHGPGEGSCGDSLPEFTLRHSALAPQHLHHYHAFEEADPQLDAARRHHNPHGHGQRQGQGGVAARAATLPVPTPPRAAGLASAATVPAADSGSADRDVVGALVRLHRPTSALARAQQLQLQQEQMQLQQQQQQVQQAGKQVLMPLAAGASAGHSAFAAPLQQQHQQPHYQQQQQLETQQQQQQQQQDGGGGGNNNSVFMLHQMASDVLRITRRSSSDLSRAAQKFKNAKSLLAAALRRPRTGSKDGTPASMGGLVGASGAGAGVLLPGAAPALGGSGVAGAGLDGAATGQQPMQQAQLQRDGGAVRDNSRLRVAAVGVGAAAAGPPGSVAAGKPEAAGAAGAAAAPGPAAAGGAAGAATQSQQQQHHHHQHQHGGTQVALAGGVMTKPSADEPAWARISTVRWGPAPAQAAAPAAGGTAAATKGPPAAAARHMAAGAAQPIAGR